MKNTISSIADAIQRGDSPIVLNGVHTRLPAPQTAGTMTQQRAYAQMKAKEILNK